MNACTRRPLGRSVVTLSCPWAGSDHCDRAVLIHQTWLLFLGLWDTHTDPRVFHDSIHSPPPNRRTSSSLARRAMQRRGLLARRCFKRRCRNASKCLHSQPILCLGSLSLNLPTTLHLDCRVRSFVLDAQQDVSGTASNSLDASDG